MFEDGTIIFDHVIKNGTDIKEEAVSMKQIFNDFEEEVIPIKQHSFATVEDSTNTVKEDTIDGNNVVQNDPDVEEEVVQIKQHSIETVEEDGAADDIPSDCMELLAASANQYGKLKKENYFIFTDGMSNGY